jgi:acyl carrier protein
MTDKLKEKIMTVVEQTLNDASTEASEHVTITENDSMETIGSWDSLNFMLVFQAINDAFNINPDFDDAINYISISALYDYLKDKTS